MKYLIDGVNKSVFSLAAQYEYLKRGDEYLVYDDTFSNIEGLDLVQSKNFTLETKKETKEEQKARIEGVSKIAVIEKKVIQQKDTDSRRFKITNDFKKALEWCDCYVNFRSIPYELTIACGVNEVTDQIEEMLERLEMAKMAKKKIYLGNTFSKEFVDVIDNYEGCINTMITKKDLEELRELGKGMYQGNTFSDVNVTMIVGTNSSSGKFSCALDVKQYYESLGERVMLIHSEETYPFLDNEDETIIGFCRNFSELNTDEDFEYLQNLVVKEILDKHPERIIFVTQGGIGLDGVLLSYQETKNGHKMKGLWDIFIERAFGLGTVIVTANYNRLDTARRILKYYQIQNTVGTPFLYINPITYGGEDEIIYTKEDKSEFYKTSAKGSVDEILMNAKAFQLDFPEVEIKCKYGNITEEVNKFRESEEFEETRKSIAESEIMKLYSTKKEKVPATK